jgi:hypothetical protein
VVDTTGRYLLLRPAASPRRCMRGFIHMQRHQEQQMSGMQRQHMNGNVSIIDITLFVAGGSACPTSHSTLIRLIPFYLQIISLHLLTGSPFIYISSHCTYSPTVANLKTTQSSSPTPLR